MSDQNDHWHEGEHLPWHTRTLDKAAAKLKMPESGRAELQQLTTHPVQWLRGNDLPDGVLQPWEKLLWGVGAFLRNSAAGFDGRDRLWRTAYGVDPLHIMWQNIINTVWCGLNDPLIGQFMDRRPFQDNTYRWFMRINHFIGQCLTLLFMFDFGLSSMQRVIIFGVVHGANNIFWTMGQISEEKFFAGLTPLSEERAKLQVWQHTFHKLAYALFNLPQLMMGLIPEESRERWTDQRIYIQGFSMLFPFALAGGVVHTFGRNRVTFDHTKNTTHTNNKQTNVPPPEEKFTLREMFAVIKHNKYLLFWMIANFFNTFIPGFDSWLFWRFLAPTIRLGGVDVGGPAIPVAFGWLTGLPISFLVPFMRQIVNIVGGPKRTLILTHLSDSVVRVVQFFIGYQSRNRIIGHFALDTIRETMWPIAGVADRVLNFEMLDYVEYKTGVRSEGINRAIVGFTEKLIKSNINTVTGNVFQHWAQVHTIDGNVPNPVIPDRFRRWAWPVWILGGALGSITMLIARAAFPYKNGQNVHIEAELKARRELAQQALESLEQETVEV